MATAQETLLENVFDCSLVILTKKLCRIKTKTAEATKRLATKDTQNRVPYLHIVIVGRFSSTRLDL